MVREKVGGEGLSVENVTLYHTTTRFSVRMCQLGAVLYRLGYPGLKKDCVTVTAELTPPSPSPNYHSGKKNLNINGTLKDESWLEFDI